MKRSFICPPAVLKAVLVVTSLFGLKCSSAPTNEECVLLLDRYTGFMIDQSRLKATESERKSLKQAARERAFNDPEFWRCSDALSRAAFDCAMAAANADEIERCLL